MTHQTHSPEFTNARILITFSQFSDSQEFTNSLIYSPIHLPINSIQWLKFIHSLPGPFTHFVTHVRTRATHHSILFTHFSDSLIFRLTLPSDSLTVWLTSEFTQFERLTHSTSDSHDSPLHPKRWLTAIITHLLTHTLKYPTSTSHLSHDSRLTHLFIQNSDSLQFSLTYWLNLSDSPTYLPTPDSPFHPKQWLTSLTHLLTHTRTYSLNDSFTHLPNHDSPTHPKTVTQDKSLTHQLTHSPSDSLTHLTTRLFIQNSDSQQLSLTHLPTHARKPPWLIMTPCCGLEGRMAVISQSNYTCRR